MIALEKITQAATAAGLDFLVIGGYAVMAHGFTRVTLDLDLLIRVSEKEKWKMLMNELGWTLAAASSGFLQFDPSNDLQEPVDLVMVNDDSFAQMRSVALASVLYGINANIVSLLHLVALKSHAVKHGHAGRVEKDVDDLIQLVKHNKLDVQDSGFRATVLKYGIPELYEKLRRAAGNE